MRVRDVEIALVLAREMKDAAARDVEASLRLEQLKEVFGASDLDAGERARIQTALQMAGLEPQPSLLEADPSEAIRFAVVAEQTSAPAAPPAEQAQEFPTVGEFARSTFGRFRKKKRGGDDEVLTATGETQDAGAEAEAPVEDRVEEPELEEPAVNGNGHAHIDLLDDVALPPHDTATPADFGASADTIDFDDPRLEEELLYEEEEEEEEDWELEPEPELELEEPGLEPPIEELEGDFEPEPEPELEREPEPEFEPEPEHAPEPVAAEVAAPPQGARVEEIAALLLPLVAIPVLITSFAGWSFGLPFVALSLIATGILAGRRAGFLSTLRHSPAARTIFKTTLLVTAASAAVGIVLANVGGGSGGDKPAAKTSNPPPAATKEPSKPAEKPKASKQTEPAPAPEPKTTPKPRTPAAPAPDDSTKGLIRVPPQSSGSESPTQTQTTPAPQQQTP